MSGLSGSGKSSIVFAGLIPRLRAKGEWLIESFRPQGQPFYLLVSALLRSLEPEKSVTEQSVQALTRIAELGTSVEQQILAAQRILASIFQCHPNKRLLLVVDQFEELYTLCEDTKEQEGFVDVLLAMINKSAARNLTVILTLRVDFLSYVLSHHPFGVALGQHPPLFLNAMNSEEMKAAIELPAQEKGVQVEKELTAQILNEIKEESRYLPLLEFALEQLWEKQSRGKLTYKAYTQIGGVAKALVNHAKDVYEKLDEVKKKQAQKIFLRLVNLGEGTEDTRRLATRSEVENWDLVTYLAGEKARLLVTGRNEQTKEDNVEIVHEVLIREWTQLKTWINDNRQELIQIKRIEVLAKEWDRNGQEPDFLLKGKQLKEFKKLGQKIRITQNKRKEKERNEQEKTKKINFEEIFIILIHNIERLIFKISKLLSPQIAEQFSHWDHEFEKDDQLELLLIDEAEDFLLKSYPSIQDIFKDILKSIKSSLWYVIIFLIVLIIISAIYVIPKRTNNYNQLEQFNKFISETRIQCENSEVKRKIEEQVERDEDLSNYDFSCRERRQLEGINLSRTILRNTKFARANLKNASFLNAELNDASFQGADLSSANLHFTDLRGADLSNANLSNANLKGALFNKKTKLPFSRNVAIDNQQMYEIEPKANLTNADLKGTNLINADLRGGNLSHADLRSANLTNAVLRGANLTNADLEGTKLRGAKFMNANLKDAHLINTDVRGAHLSCTNLSNAHLNYSNLGGADLSCTNDLTKTNLESANLNNTNLNQASLKGANLNQASFRGANLKSANLSNTNLTDANLAGANLEGANLEGANLTNANLTNANLTNANLTDANLEGTYLDNAKLEKVKLDPKKIQAASGWRRACHSKEFRKELGLSTKNPDGCVRESDEEQLYLILLLIALVVTIILISGYVQLRKKYFKKQSK